jgi:5-methyltetrahydropteroyltriglutamate--homocysteine methyltransferase
MLIMPAAFKDYEGTRLVNKLLPTTIVGSYPPPEWLVDRQKLLEIVVPRVRAKEIWRVPAEFLEQAQDDATILAIREQERAGIDIVTDGEIRRESYSNRFATALEGIDNDNPGKKPGRTPGRFQIVPRVVGKIRRKAPVELNDVKFLRANTDRKIKITIPGPFTMVQQAMDEFYKDEEKLALDYAAAVNEEVKDLFAAGADVVQLDEPYMQAQPEKARAYAVKAIDRALDGVKGTTAVHLCFGYAHFVKNRANAYAFLEELAKSKVDQVSIETAQPDLDCAVLARLPGKTIIIGVINMSDEKAETPEIVAARIRKALPHVPADRLVVAPDCGFKYMKRDLAYAKMKAMCEGAAIVRREIEGKKS